MRKKSMGENPGKNKSCQFSPRKMCPLTFRYNAGEGGQGRDHLFVGADMIELGEGFFLGPSMFLCAKLQA